ncbi:hypothetical protein ABW19_dt0204918 [Dactylella cylindrospora]|nr:hypothetical protein ABW19_dt0204918 [Dactylella cylindrospora]
MIYLTKKYLLYASLLAAWPCQHTAYAQTESADWLDSGEMSWNITSIGSLEPFQTPASCLSTVLVQSLSWTDYAVHRYKFGCDVNATEYQACCPPSYTPLGYYYSESLSCPDGYTERQSQAGYWGDETLDLTAYVGTTTARFCCPILP